MSRYGESHCGGDAEMSRYEGIPLRGQVNEGQQTTTKSRCFYAGFLFSIELKEKK
jgi:hypothetical protein